VRADEAGSPGDQQSHDGSAYLRRVRGVNARPLLPRRARAIVGVSPFG
jgi:hypothetical protein